MNPLWTVLVTPDVRPAHGCDELGRAEGPNRHESVDPVHPAHQREPFQPTPDPVGIHSCAPRTSMGLPA